MRDIPTEVVALRGEIEKLKIRIDRAINTSGQVRVVTDGSGSVGVFAPHDHQGDGDGGVLTNSQHDGYDDFAEIAAPATPAAGTVRLYAKADGNIYQKDDAGTESNLNAAGGAVDADDVTYTPLTLADWDGAADPGDVEQALDQLAERTTDLEGGGGAGHTIKENGTPQTARAGLNFVDPDAGATLVSDDVGNDETDVNLGLYVLEAAVPGGELGGTYAAPTIDATHSGSTHSAAADAHIADATDAHDASAISILDAAADFTATDVEGALAELQSDNEAHVAAADPHTGYALDTDLSTHAGAADPHTGYRLESDDHTHQSTGAQAGTLDHGLALTGLTDDDHTQYLKEKAAGGTAAEVPEHTHAGASTAGQIDADDVTYIATTAADWDGAADPGDVEQALDQLAERTKDLEAHGHWIAVAHWFIGGPLFADTSNHQGAVIPLPNGTTAITLVEGSSIQANVGTAPTGASLLLDIKHSTTVEGSQTSIFDGTSYPTIAATDTHVADTSSNDGVIDTSPDYTSIDGGWLRLFIRQVGSTERGRDLTVTVFAKVYPQ